MDNSHLFSDKSFETPGLLLRHYSQQFSKLTVSVQMKGRYEPWPAILTRDWTTAHGWVLESSVQDGPGNLPRGPAKIYRRTRIFSDYTEITGVTALFPVCPHYKE